MIQNTAGGLVHIGPSYHMQVVQQPQHGDKKEALDTGPDKLVPPKESVRPLWYSTRVMQVRLKSNTSYEMDWIECQIGWWAAETVKEHWSRVEKCGKWTEVQLGTGRKIPGVIISQTWNDKLDVFSSHTNCISWNNLKQILGVREKQSIECYSGA